MKRFFALLLAVLLLAGCGGTQEPDQTEPPTFVVPENITPVNYGPVAELYFPKTGIVNPPTVVQPVTGLAGLPNEAKTPAVSILPIDGQMNIVDGKRVLCPVDTFLDLYRDRVIPAFFVDSMEEAEALMAYLRQNEIRDSYVMSADPALVRHVREGYQVIQGALWMETLEDHSQALMTANRALASVICTKDALDAEQTAWFNTRLMSLWCVAKDEAAVWQAIASGWNGILSQDADSVFAVYESITETTVCGKSIPIGHRGTYEYLENTISSFRMAYEQHKCPAVELDLRLSRDGQIVIMHDATVDRTTNGSGKVADMTLEELEQLQVIQGGNGESDMIPTFEGVLQAFFNTDLVLVCHINVADQTMRRRFTELVEEYGYEDRVVAFFGNSNRTKNNYTNYPDSIAFASGSQDEYLMQENASQVVETFLDQLLPYHSQPLFYDYQPDDAPQYDHGTPEFYYALCARGYLNWHSTTTGQEKVERTLLTKTGAAAALLNKPYLTKDFFYYLQAEDQTLAAGTKMDLTATAVGQTGTETVTCGYIQLSGPTLENDTLSTAGTVELVLFRQYISACGDHYRILSTPITVTFE